MKFMQLLEIVRDEALFESSVLLAGAADPKAIQKQLSRWTEQNRLIRVRRGLYALAAPFQKTWPHPFWVANHMVQGSYVSCESALAFYGMIPEHVPVTVSVSLSRPGTWENPFGVFQFHQFRKTLHFGYIILDLDSRHPVCLASPEKALLDLIHLRPGGDKPGFIQSLRLQNLEKMNPESLSEFASRSGSKKLKRAAEMIIGLAAMEREGYRPL